MFQNQVEVVLKYMYILEISQFTKYSFTIYMVYDSGCDYGTIVFVRVAQPKGRWLLE